jgi:hypothetical protein
LRPNCLDQFYEDPESGNQFSCYLEFRSSERQRVSSGELFYITLARKGSYRDDEVQVQGILLNPIASNAAANREAAVRRWFQVVQPVT